MADMSTPHPTSGEGCELGIVGLGAMGHNLLLNAVDRGLAVAGLDRDPAAAARTGSATTPGNAARIGVDASAFVATLRAPRVVMLLVPAGEAVDATLQQLAPLLAPDDVVIDAGNSHFRDTERRIDDLDRRGVHLLGLGVSGGPRGARQGPGLMPGGSRAAYERAEPLLARLAARLDDEPNVAYLGAGGAGHHVKMVHNGIEYGVMQLLAEAYALLREVGGLEIGAVAEICERWRGGALAGQLLDITTGILGVTDPDTGRPLLELLSDAASQSGTGRWTSEEALALHVPTPTIDAAVAMRNLSSLQAERHALAAILPRTPPVARDTAADLVDRLGHALEAALLVTYAQGFALLGRASLAHGFGCDLPTVARIWRTGCIISAAVLDDLHAALAADPARPHPLLHVPLAEAVARHTGDLGEVVALSARAGTPTPALAASHAYLAALRSDRLPTALIQAQRDAFGGHGYLRRDREGKQHTDWPRPGGASR
jgi:6-phosphogluconate dehydrogenase